MTRRTVLSVAGVVAVAIALLLLLGSRPDGKAPTVESAPVVRVEPPRPASLASPPSPPEPAPEPPTTPVADEDAVVGRVLNAAGAPVAGAEVTTIASKAVPGPTGADAVEREERTVATGDDGRFRVAPLRRDLPHALRIRSAGHGDFLRTFVPRADGPGEIDLGDLTLPPARTIRGVARESTGRPLARATVRARLHRKTVPGEATLGTALLERRETADVDGHFRLGDLAPGVWVLWLESQGRDAARLPVRVPAERDPDPVALVIESGRTLTLVFVDEAGRPVTGLHVYARAPGERLQYAGHPTDDEGRVSLAWLPRRPLRFFTHEALEPGETARFAPEEFGPLVPEGQEMRVVLQSPSYLRGRVVDGSGRPLEDMRIDPWESAGRLYSMSVFSREDGRFELPIPTRRPVELRVDGNSSRRDGSSVSNASTAWRGSLGPVEAPADGLVLRCVRPPADRALRVRVIDADGVPVRGAYVDWLDAEGSRTAETGADGLARCEGMLAARTRVSCRTPPSEPMPAGQIAPVSIEVVPEGQQVEMPYRRGVPFTVVVTDPAGAGIPGARISIESPARNCWPRVGTTDERGSFTIAVEERAELEEVSASWKSPEGLTTKSSRRWVDTEPGRLEMVIDTVP